MVNYHVFSSVWTGCKGLFSVVEDHMSWLIGNGENIKFWTDNWCGKKLIDIVQLPFNLQRNLQAKLSDFIHDHSVCIPPNLLFACPLLQQLVPLVSVNPLGDDKVFWKDTNNGLLSVITRVSRGVNLFGIRRFRRWNLYCFGNWFLISCPLMTEFLLKVGCFLHNAVFVSVVRSLCNI